MHKEHNSLKKTIHQTYSKYEWLLLYFKLALLTSFNNSYYFFVDSFLYSQGKVVFLSFQYKNGYL